MSGIKIVFGTAGPFWNSEAGPKALDILRQENLQDIDTARRYGDSEEKLGKHGAAQDFNIGTKFSGPWTGIPATREEILKSATTSFDLLRTDQVDIYYLHAPDRSTPLEETLAVINELYEQGRFKRFGLSNFLPEEVEEVIRIAKEKGYVSPTVYEGNYSPVARKVEKTLFPLLQQNGIAFYAYSPLAGGFLTKTRAEIEAKVGRFDASNYVGKIYTTLYSKPAYLDALSTWEAISTESGIPKAELAYRWVAHNSPLRSEKGDAVIFGASSLEQMRQTILGIKKGPLPDTAVKQVEEVWNLIKDEAGLDNFNLNNA